jgi:hypothetical protein
VEWTSNSPRSPEDRRSRHPPPSGIRMSTSSSTKKRVSPGSSADHRFFNRVHEVISHNLHRILHKPSYLHRTAATPSWIIHFLTKKTSAFANITISCTQRWLSASMSSCSSRNQTGPVPDVRYKQSFIRLFTRSIEDWETPREHLATRAYPWPPWVSGHTDSLPQRPEHTVPPAAAPHREHRLNARTIWKYFRCLTHLTWPRPPLPCR